MILEGDGGKEIEVGGGGGREATYEFKEMLQSSKI